MTGCSSPGERGIVHRYDSVASTMDIIHRLAERGAPSGTVVVAAEQTAGRGSRGRTWHSPRGGLWMSLLLRPAPGGMPLLSLRAGLAAAEAIERVGEGLAIAIKWPNDLHWRDRKVGGVLCEARWVADAPAWTAVGIGINVGNPVPAELAGTAIALGGALGAMTPEELLERLLPGLERLGAGGSTLGADELAALARRDWLRGRSLAAPVRGIAEGIAPDGALLVRGADGTLAELRSGPVELADRAATP